MTAQKGKDILIKILTSLEDQPKAYETMAGLRAHNISLNTTSVDVSNASQSHQWRELLAGAGIQTMSVSGEGVFRDGNADEKIRSEFINGTISEWLIHIPSFYDVSGKFQVTGLEYAGEYDGEVTWRMSLESAGELTFSATSDA